MGLVSVQLATHLEDGLFAETHQLHAVVILALRNVLELRLGALGGARGHLRELVVLCRASHRGHVGLAQPALRTKGNWAEMCSAN